MTARPVQGPGDRPAPDVPPAEATTTAPFFTLVGDAGASCTGDSCAPPEPDPAR